MIKNQLISIIVPVYNGEKYLNECLESIINNTYKNIEIIIVDDGSTDGSADICKKYMEIDSRIKYFYQKNGGIVSARNLGLKKSIGAYICFSDQDDIVSIDAYEQLYNGITKDDSDICIGAFSYLKGKKIEQNNPTFKKKYEVISDVDNYLVSLSNACFRNNYYLTDYNYSWTIWNCIYKSKIIKKNNILFHKFVNYEDDFLFNFDFALNSKKISFINHNVYYWRQNFESESHVKKYVTNFAEKNEMFNNYIVEYMKNKNIQFDTELWNSKFYSKNLTCAIINEANIKNKYQNKINIHKLNVLYDNYKNKNMIFQRKFSLKELLISSEPFTYYCCKNGYIKLAYYYNKLYFNKFYILIINFIRKMKYVF